jgi:hypothetical protein
MLKKPRSSQPDLAERFPKMLREICNLKWTYPTRSDQRMRWVKRLIIIRQSWYQLNLQDSQRSERQPHDHRTGHRKER